MTAQAHPSISHAGVHRSARRGLGSDQALVLLVCVLAALGMTALLAMVG
jgi:hypothetical protein